METVEIPIPESYKDMMESLDEELEEDMRDEIGKQVMDIIHETSKANIQEEDIDGD